MRHAPPHFIAIGASHAGLSTILPLLAAHPQIADKFIQTHYFALATDKRGTIEDYRAQFSKRANLVVGESSPAYLTKPEVVTQIVKANPDTKLIVCLQHPLRRLVQEYAHIRTTTPGPRQHRNAYAYAYAVTAALERGLYAKYLREYFAYYSPVQIHIFLYEDFLEDPLKELSKLYTFLEVKPDYVPRPLRAYAPKEDEPKRKPFIVKRLIRFVRRQITEYYDRKVHLELPPPVSLARNFSPEEQQYLTEFYRPDAAELTVYLGRDMTVFWEL
jgi:hypothetical protein